MVHKNAPPKVATAGEALIDLIGNDAGHLEPCLGGAVYNLTRALALQGVDTTYLNPLSQDRFGRQLAAGLEAAGVHLGAAQPVQQVTSLAVVGVGAQGVPHYSFYREGVADRATSASALTAACDAMDGLQLVCTGALALSPQDGATYLPWLLSQREAGRTVVIDANLRPSVMPDLTKYRSHVLNALQYAHIIKVSDEDLECLGLPGTTAQARASALLDSTRAHCVALTQGAKGATLLTRFGQTFHARETQAVNLVDTVGAGDCFLAGLVVALLEAGIGKEWGLAKVDPTQAQALLANAVASASICVMRRGCVPPTRSEVKARLSSVAMEFSEPCA